jgi:hypothetical protein
MMKILVFLCFLILTGNVQAQALSFDPDTLVSLRLISGETLRGRIIDADAQQLHLAGSQVNRLIPFRLLSEKSRTELTFVSAPGYDADVSAGFQGLNVTRSLLQKSQHELEANCFKPSRFPEKTIIGFYHLSWDVFPVSHF